MSSSDDDDDSLNVDLRSENVIYGYQRWTHVKYLQLNIKIHYTIITIISTRCLYYTNKMFMKVMSGKKAAYKWLFSVLSTS